MEEFTRIWTIFAEHVGKVVERVQELPTDQLRFVAALASSAFLLILVAWVGALRKLRRIRKELVEVQAQSKGLQVKYDAEVKWRTAAERVQEGKSERTTSEPAAPTKAAQQTTGIVASAQLQAPSRARATSAPTTTPLNSSTS